MRNYLFLACLFAGIHLQSFSQEKQYYEPLNPTYLPTQSSTMPSWAKLLYEKEINVKKIDKAYLKYYKKDIPEKESDLIGIDFGAFKVSAGVSAFVRTDSFLN